MPSYTDGGGFHRERAPRTAAMHACAAASGKSSRSDAAKLRNRQHAKNSRKRRLEHVASLEARLRCLEADTRELRRQEAALAAENAALAQAHPSPLVCTREDAAGGGNCAWTALEDALGSVCHYEPWASVPAEAWGGTLNASDGMQFLSM